MALSKQAELEALLFASGTPLTLDAMAKTLYTNTAEVISLLETLQNAYMESSRGLMLRQVAGGWQMVTKPEAAKILERLRAGQEVKLSKAAMETLAIIAFKQPVTRSEMEAIRGVKVDGVLNTLLELGLTGEVGRKDVVGRPILYGTTEKFLTTFGLNSLEDLPALPEDLLEAGEKEPETLFEE